MKEVSKEFMGQPGPGAYDPGNLIGTNAPKFSL